MQFLSKRCATCRVVKLLDDFHRQPSGAHGRFAYCKPCANARARDKRIRHDTPEKRRKWNLSTRYGLTSSCVTAKLDAQQGLCAICKQSMRRVCIDHDHATGRVRDLLCHRCNISLHWIENLSYRAAALAYLEKHR